MKVTVSRKAHFNAAHRLFVENWSDKKNKNLFGKCSNPNFHGHNYDLIVDVTNIGHADIANLTATLGSISSYVFSIHWPHILQ